MSSEAIPTYQSRHEIESKEQDEMAKDNDSNTSTGSQYLQEVLGDVLADALSKVAKERPIDPIQYVADYLHGLKGPSKGLEETFQNSLDIKEDEPEELEQEDEFEEQESPEEKRTTQSEPPPSIQGSIFTDSNPGSSTSNASTTIILEEEEENLIRTASLDRNQFKKAQRRGRKS